MELKHNFLFCVIILGIIVIGMFIGAVMGDTDSE